MLSNCRVMPVQFWLTSAMSNSITPGVATDHQSPKRGETQVRQNPLRQSLLAQSSMGKQLNARNRRKLHVAIMGGKGPQPKKARDREPGYVKETWWAPHRNPADSGTLQMTTNGSTERGNPLRLSQLHGEQVSTGCLSGRGFFKKLTPQGKPGDMLT
jgi:hypothetical protein